MAGSGQRPRTSGDWAYEAGEAIFVSLGTGSPLAPGEAFALERFLVLTLSLWFGLFGIGEDRSNENLLGSGGTTSGIGSICPLDEIL
jgi:hypothetical protein